MKEEVFEQYYKAHAAKALRAATAIVRNDELAADVVQETFLRVYRSMHRIDPARAFEPWLYRILINECNRALSKKREHIPIEECNDLTGPVTSDYRELYDAVGQLDESQRVPLVLRYIIGYSDKEAAKILRINLTTQKARVKRAKEKIKIILSRGGSL